MRSRSKRLRSALPAPSPLIARPRCEPVEVESPVNVALDLIEAHIRDVLRAGGEHALQSRLERLVPDLVTRRAGSAAAITAATGSGSLPPVRPLGGEVLQPGKAIKTARLPTFLGARNSAPDLKPTQVSRQRESASSQILEASGDAKKKGRIAASFARHGLAEAKAFKRQMSRSLGRDGIETSSGTSGGLQADADRLHDLISDIEKRIALAAPQCDGDVAALSVLLLSYLDSLSYSPALLAPTADSIEGRVYALAERLAGFLVERSGGLVALGMEQRFGNLFKSAGPVSIGEPVACGAAS